MRAPDDTGRQRMVRAALDAAAEAVTAHGWDGLHVQGVAARIGVSRQTIYNAFSNRRGLAQALVLRRTDEFLAGVERALAGSDDVGEQWRAAVLYTLESAAADPLLAALLVADGSGDLLPLLTQDAGPIIDAARRRLADAVRRTRPDVTPHEARQVVETATRLAISHVVLPLHPSSEVAEHIATVVTRYLGGPGGTGSVTAGAGVPSSTTRDQAGR